MISVSFIIPVYNTPETLLRRCIDCILIVIGNCDAEIIVVDDGSTDGSYNICKEYEKKDRRVKVFNFNLLTTS